MDKTLIKLHTECLCAIDEFLSIECWGSAKAKVRACIVEMLTGSKSSTNAVAWLINQTASMPVQAQSARRLRDLIHAVAALRQRAAYGVVSLALERFAGEELEIDARWIAEMGTESGSNKRDIDRTDRSEETVSASPRRPAAE